MMPVVPRLLVLFVALGSASLHADTLADIYELALENDALLKSQEATYLANLEVEKQTRAALLPNVQGSYQYTDSETDRDAETFDVGPGGIEAINTSTNTDVDNEGYQITLNQAIFDLPAWFTFKSGQLNTQQAESVFAADQQDLIVRTVDSYLNVLRAQSNLEASQARERAFKRQLEQTQQRFEVGLIAITDVHESQAAYDGSRVDRIVDENNVNIAMEELSVLTGRYHANLHVLKPDFGIKAPEPEMRSEWVDFALENNFRLAAARHAEEEARQVSRANTAEHLPTVTGSILYSDFETRGDTDQTPESDFLVNPDTDLETEQYTISIDVPIFAGGGISASRRQAVQQYIASKESRVNLMRQTVTQTRSRHMSVISDVSRVAARAQSITSTQSAVDATQAGYEVGTRNIVDVLQAQNSLFSAKRDYANARYDYISNLLGLKLQAGLLSPEDVYRLDEQLMPPATPTATRTQSSPYPSE